MKALVLSSDGLTREVDFGEEGEPTCLAMLQAEVEGYVEAHDLPNTGVTMWCNEDGKNLESCELNDVATTIFQRAFNTLDFIMGHVVFTGQPDDEGNTKGLNNSELIVMETLIPYVKALP